MATFQALLAIRQRLPMPLLGIDSDNGSEFISEAMLCINAHLLRYCQQQQITFTRCRPNKKNDQAHVEQKNWSAIRRLVGYDRYQSPEALRILNAFYEVLRLYLNFFQPVIKLISKERIGSRVKKVYDAQHRFADEARTPYQRVWQSADVSQVVKDELRKLYLSLNPVTLHRYMEDLLNALWDLAEK